MPRKLLLNLNLRPRNLRLKVPRGVEKESDSRDLYVIYLTIKNHLGAIKVVRKESPTRYG